MDIRKCQNFNNRINHCRLMEVTTAGTKFTWRGPKWNGRDGVFKRLDHILCNVSWRLRFHDGIAKVFPGVQYDHHPIIVHTEEELVSSRDLPSRFEAAWITHEDFQNFLSNKLGDGSVLVNYISIAI